MNATTIAKFKRFVRGIYPQGVWDGRFLYTADPSDPGSIGAEIDDDCLLLVFYGNGNRGYFSIYEGHVTLTNMHKEDH